MPSRASCILILRSKERDFAVSDMEMQLRGDHSEPALKLQKQLIASIDSRKGGYSGKTVNTEPRADRGPKLGSTAGVVEAPDATIKFGVKQNVDFISQIDFGMLHYRA
jgi:hypothetical protein